MPALKTNPDGSPHIHIWIRATKPDGLKDRSTYCCAHPDCIVKMSKYDLLGKRSLCSTCAKNELILTVADLKRSRPRCLECSTNAEAAKIREKKKILEEMGIV